MGNASLFPWVAILPFLPPKRLLMAFSNQSASKRFG
jgi:hypothetical protein